MTKPKKPVITEIESTIAAVEGADAPLESETSEEQTPPFEIPTLPAEIGPHALDLAPVNSKVVVVRLQGEPAFAVLATPDSASRLPEGDLAHTLPEGARIRKTGPETYVAEQLSPAESRNVLTTASAGDAIAGFIAWFHGPATPENAYQHDEPQD